MDAIWLVVIDILNPFQADFSKVCESHSSDTFYFCKWSGVSAKNVVMGDDCGCQNLESSLNDPILCGCCDYHEHIHVRPKNDIPDFKPCQKKHDGKYCSCQSCLGL
jgi:hypothetical protein